MTENTALSIALAGTQTLAPVKLYGTTQQNRYSTSTTTADQLTLSIDGNGWRQILINYNITEDTVLEFEFKSTSVGEIHGIGFDNNSKIQGSDRNHFFQLYRNGKEKFGLTNFNNYGNEVEPGEWQTYKIRVGDFFTGQAQYLTFANDHDVTNPTANSQFRNLKLYESPPLPPSTTVIFAQATDAIAVNLQEGLVTYYSGTSPNTPLKIMTLGDSNTRGVGDDPSGYRDDLWQLLANDNYDVDFVGTRSSGLVTFDDDHEGHGGWRIRELTQGRASVSNEGSLPTWLSQTQPDVVLLMIGTNDTKSRKLSQMQKDLNELIDAIATQSPNTYILVGSIPPTVASPKRTQLTQHYNAILPNLVNTKAQEGKQVRFLDIASALSSDDLLSDGVHLTPEGYAKVANVWHGALSELINSGLKQSISPTIQNVVGSSYNDILIGNSAVNILNGDLGHDSLTGLGSGDTFVIASGQGIDTITDFNPSEGDSLGLLAGDLAPEQLSFVQFNNDALIIFGTETLAILNNADANLLQANAPDLFVILDPSILTS